ncbi:MAG TPA: hypothetical protein VFG30_28840 [Polyangiales bacterium]|nr:hypothetical protein [Polyangiales bacterium]
MFVENVAFEPVPDYARVQSDVLREVRSRLLREPSLAAALDSAFVAIERRQPAVATFIAHDLAGIDAPTAQGVAYFLAMTVVLSFEESFGRRLGCVDLADLRDALERLLADGELRATGNAGRFYSEDALALGQPAIIKLLRAEFDVAIGTLPRNAESERDAADLTEQLETFYQTLLVLTLTLTHAVAPASDRTS